MSSASPCPEHVPARPPTPGHPQHPCYVALSPSHHQQHKLRLDPSPGYPELEQLHGSDRSRLSWAGAAPGLWAQFHPTGAERKRWPQHGSAAPALCPSPATPLAPPRVSSWHPLNGRALCAAPGLHWGSPRPAAALAKVLPARRSHSGSPFIWGVPKKTAPTLLVWEAEHTQSNMDDPLLKGFCAADAAGEVAGSKPPGTSSKPGAVPPSHGSKRGSTGAPRPGSSSGAADPHARKANLLTNAFIRICEPTQKFYPEHPYAETHPSLVRCRKKPPFSLNLPVPRAPPHWETGHSSPKPLAPNHRLFSLLLLPEGEQRLRNPHGSDGGKGVGSSRSFTITKVGTHRTRGGEDQQQRSKTPWNKKQH